MERSAGQEMMMNLMVVSGAFVSGFLLGQHFAGVENIKDTWRIVRNRILHI